ncbi:HD domain-containing protein [Microaerobacter geothermalis]|uniref:HD-GYP domain-containing protein n=1 Tax=Microaerobacter geothermalis TaxID=674972 RepID=UPI001F42139F|nr:HD domain-containing phosphohydrolase [Microaerobacter geothermalis]MCF6094303.1 HD domain-containing protein [Microaerobacter geothermalis]
MRYIHLDNTEPGQILGKSIYTSEGRTLLNSGVQLTVGMINKLRRVGVSMLYILDDRFDDLVMEDVVAEETRREALKNISEAVHCVQSGKDFDTKEITNSVKNIIDEILRNKNVLLNLTDVRTQDNQLFVHCLNVGIMATIIGVNMGFNQNQLQDLAIGAFLHDIGKLVKDNSLQEDHTWKGFNLLRKKHEFSILSAHVALQHHENVDGSGTPRGIDGEEIHQFAKITSVANYYDNLISPFSGERPYLPHEATERIMALANKMFDHDIVIQFLRSIAIYPTGVSVKLSSGEIGVVVGQHRGLPARPIVRIIGQTDEADYNEVKEIDLAKATTLFIKQVLQ